MAAATFDIARFGSAFCTVTYDDVTGAISSLDWSVAPYTLTLTVQQPGKQDIVVTAPDPAHGIGSTGSRNVPNGYALVPGPRGGWVWGGGISVTSVWTK